MQQDMELMESLNRLNINSSRTQRTHTPSYLLSHHFRSRGSIELRQIYRQVKRVIRNSCVYKEFRNDFKSRRFIIEFCNHRSIVGTLRLVNRKKLYPKNEMNSVSSFEIRIPIRYSEDVICAKIRIYKNDQLIFKRTHLKEESYIIEETQQKSTIRDLDQTDLNDLSVDELSSYFETMLYIPKKMSIMAEQMYT